MAQQADGSHSNPEGQVADSQDDNNALLEVRISVAPLRRHCADFGHRLNCHRPHQLHCLIMMK